jgi:hypothetical protein
LANNFTKHCNVGGFEIQLIKDTRWLTVNTAKHYFPTASTSPIDALSAIPFGVQMACARDRLDKNSLHERQLLCA